MISRAADEGTLKHHFRSLWYEHDHNTLPKKKVGSKSLTPFLINTFRILFAGWRQSNLQILNQHTHIPLPLLATTKLFILTWKRHNPHLLFHELKVLPLKKIHQQNMIRHELKLQITKNSNEENVKKKNKWVSEAQLQVNFAENFSLKSRMNVFSVEEMIEAAEMAEQAEQQAGDVSNEVIV